MSTPIELRIKRLEEAFMLFCALITGEPPDASHDDKETIQVRFAALMESMRDEFVAHNESLAQGIRMNAAAGETNASERK